MGAVGESVRALASRTASRRQAKPLLPGSQGVTEGGQPVGRHGSYRALRPPEFAGYGAIVEARDGWNAGVHGPERAILAKFTVPMTGTKRDIPWRSGRSDRGTRSGGQLALAP